MHINANVVDRLVVVIAVITLSGCGQARFGGATKSVKDSDATAETAKAAGSDQPQETEASPPGAVPGEDAAVDPGKTPGSSAETAEGVEEVEGNEGLDLCQGIMVGSTPNYAVVPADAYYDVSQAGVDGGASHRGRTGFYGPEDLPGNVDDCGINIGGVSGCSDNTPWSGKGEMTLTRAVVLPPGTQHLLFCISFSENVDAWFNGELVASGEDGGFIGNAMGVPASAKPAPEKNQLVVKVRTASGKGRFNLTVRGAGGADGTMTVGSIISH